MNRTLQLRGRAGGVTRAAVLRGPRLSETSGGLKVGRFTSPPLPRAPLPAGRGAVDVGGSVDCVGVLRTAWRQGAMNRASTGQDGRA